VAETFRRLRLVLIWVAVTALISVFGVVAAVTQATAATCANGPTMNVVAHQDDDLLFQNPMILQRVKAGGCLRTVYVTAGDAGEDGSYWGDREDGVLAAYAQMLGVSDNWTSGSAGISGHPIPLYTLSGAPNV